MAKATAYCLAKCTTHILHKGVKCGLGHKRDRYDANLFYMYSIFSGALREPRSAGHIGRSGDVTPRRSSA